MKVPPSFNQRTITTTAAMALALAAPAFGKEYYHRQSWEKRQRPWSCSLRPATLIRKGPRHADRRNQCDGGPHHHQEAVEKLERVHRDDL